MRYAERKLKEARQRLVRTERSILYWSRILADISLSELAPSNISSGQRKWTNRRTERARVKVCASPYAQHRVKATLRMPR
jgi:hypothetical protein